MVSQACSAGRQARRRYHERSTEGKGRRPAEAAIRTTHKEASRSEEYQGRGGCRGQDAEGWTEEMLAWTVLDLLPWTPSLPPHLTCLPLFALFV